ncbi:uncharacterized protein [Lepeophtheirus salmonis]|uniref:uncharacterized protein n=1 Tax=Lepeophtheirus salmonis TaxID=72036 RepID=UPI001AE7B7F3|nr:uncharacterized protein LOC121118660 [Lepeophtheirus salmonis]
MDLSGARSNILSYKREKKLNLQEILLILEDDPPDASTSVYLIPSKDPYEQTDGDSNNEEAIEKYPNCLGKGLLSSDTELCTHHQDDLDNPNFDETQSIQVKRENHISTDSGKLKRIKNVMRKQSVSKYRFQCKIPPYKSSKWNKSIIPFDADSTTTPYNFLK